MTRLETTIVSLVTGLLCPAFGFVTGWWVAAALAIRGVLPLSEPMIALAAFAGLGVGLLLDGLFLRRWVARFFTVDLRILILLYLACSVMAVAAFMGVPVGNLILGGLAGVYLGRREQHAGTAGDSPAIRFQRAGLFTAAVTGAEAFAIGLIALNEDWVVEWLQAVSGMGGWALPGASGISLIVLLCGVLMIGQYWITKTAAWMAYGRKPQEGAWSMSGNPAWEEVGAGIDDHNQQITGSDAGLAIPTWIRLPFRRRSSIDGRVSGCLESCQIFRRVTGRIS